MCVDIPLCRGLLDVKIDPHQLNCIEFVWDPRPQVETKVAIKVHCISTEFTAKKHGGEKGVPFRIQVETYTHSASANDPVPLLLHCASCQVKVFKVWVQITTHSAKLIVASLFQLITSCCRRCEFWVRRSRHMTSKLVAYLQFVIICDSCLFWLSILMKYFTFVCCV